MRGALWEQGRSGRGQMRGMQLGRARGPNRLVTSHCDRGPLERGHRCRDRATAPIEDIWCEKIRGCSYSGGGASYSMSAMPP